LRMQFNLEKTLCRMRKEARKMRALPIF
jgi:hypothetical protein